MFIGYRVNVESLNSIYLDSDSKTDYINSIRCQYEKYECEIRSKASSIADFK